MLNSSDLRKYAYFSSLSGSSLDVLASQISEVALPAGSEIIREGAAGDFFYFVKQGQLEVTKKTRTGQEVKLSVMRDGDGFGEIALLTGSVRSSSVRTSTDVVLYRLAKEDFEDIVLHEAAFKNRLSQRGEEYRHFDSIKTLQPFRLLEPEKVWEIVAKLEEKTYGAGEIIVAQGERGDRYFIIKSGRVAVLKQDEAGQEPCRVAVLGEGEAFGEESLIRDDPRNATCQALVETTVFTLSKKIFNQIVKSSFLDNIFPEEISLDTYLDEYVVIDARIPSEYAEEHIYGAVNIPVEILRDVCRAFDKSKKYITYCLNDARGMVAAFLLKNRGFKAQCLRGGVGGWEGKLETLSDGVHLPER